MPSAGHTALNIGADCIIPAQGSLPLCWTGEISPPLSVVNVDGSKLAAELQNAMSKTKTAVVAAGAITLLFCAVILASVVHVRCTSCGSSMSTIYSWAIVCSGAAAGIAGLAPWVIYIYFMSKAQAASDMNFKIHSTDLVRRALPSRCYTVHV